MTTKPRRARYLYAVCMKGDGKFCKEIFFGVGGSPVTVLAVYRTRKQADEDCPWYGEVVMFREVRK